MGEEAEKVAPGCGGLIFLPYLSGSAARTFDSDARGVLWLGLEHGKGAMTRAVMEGVTFRCAMLLRAHLCDGCFHQAPKR